MGTNNDSSTLIKKLNYDDRSKVGVTVGHRSKAPDDTLLLFDES